MKKITMSLRGALTATVIGFAGLALVVSAVLIVLTTYLRRTSVVLQDSLEGVRLAQEAEILLLVHGRAVDPVARREIESGLRRALATAEDHVTTEREARLLRETSSHVGAYLTISHVESARPSEVEAHRESAYGALDALVDQNVSQAEAAMQSAERWAGYANMIGAAAAGLPLVLAGWLLAWWQVRAFRPLFALARVMERFGRGERDVRAEEAGPREVREMAAQFNTMASALAAQRETLLAFLGGVAHDLRNPLSVLATSIAALRPDRPLPPEPRVRRVVEVLARQLGHMDRMLGDFLDMARIEAGKLEMTMETHDARALVCAAAALFEASSPRHTLEVALPDEEIPVRCDALRLEQVITNLLSNAIKYSPEGGPVAVTLAREGGEAVLRVEDHGIGISEEGLRFLFEPFRREGLGGGAVPGAGLGLFGVKRIIEAHGGRIGVQSTPGRGSTFEVRLAIAAAAAPVPEAPGTPGAAPPASA